ncbi:MAG: glycosyl transferase [Muribaculaceae bacterium]|nr:glycosyl transferase [Muribaculaceae bacterium]
MAISKNNNLLNRMAISALWRTASLWPDLVYLRLMYRLKFGRSLNVKNPKTYTEKINWLKIFDKHPEYTNLVDKYKAKEFVRNRLGTDKYLIPTLGVWQSFDDINFDLLPKQFVLKTTNGGGNTSVVICKDKSNFNKQLARDVLKSKDSKKLYQKSREYCYYEVKPRIIAEEYIKATNDELSDYKFFCFDGEPKFLFIGSERQKKGEDVKFDFFDIDFNFLPIKNGHDNALIRPIKPINYDKMLEIASTLSKGFKHVRVDLYNVGGKIYFGELTFFHHGGIVPFEPDEWDYKFGEYLKL